MNAPLATLVDGIAAAHGWPLDRALHYGDGLFETLNVREGRPCFESLHRQRLALGCSRLGIRADLPLLWEQTRSLAAQHPSSTVKVLVSRGDALARGYTPTGGERARVLHLVYPAPAAAEIPVQVRVVTLTSTLGENPRLAGLKHCNRLEQVLGRQELQGAGAFEGLMGSSSGHLVSGTMSNVFVGQDGAFMTPPVDRCGVAGVMRAVVLREAAHCGLDVRIAPLPMAALRDCDSLFITNARMGVVSVHELDGRALVPSSAVQALAHRIAALAD
jgi:4-amino-4-deoxychorismate lyase